MANTLRRLWLPLLVAIIGLACLVAGVLSATVFKPADTQTVTLPQGTKAQLVVTRPGVVNLYSAPLNISVKGPKGAVLAVGRSTDIAAWADGTAHVRIDGIDQDRTFLTSAVKGDGETELISPADNDMWVKSQQVDNKAATISWNTNEDGQYSVLAYAPEGTPELTFSWKTGASTPWLWPLLIAGLVLLVASGLLAWLFLRRASRASEPEPNDFDEADQTWTDDPAQLDSAEETTDEYYEEDDQSYSESGWTGEYVTEPYSYETTDGDEGSTEDDGYSSDGYYDEDGTFISYAPDDYVTDRGVSYEDRYGVDDCVAYDAQYLECELNGTQACTFEIPSDEYEGETDDEADFSEPDFPAISYDHAPVEQDYSQDTWDRPVIPPTPMMPSRRDMREARKRGEATIEVDGVKFPTGLIPVVRDAVLPVNDSDEGAGVDEFRGDSAFEERQ